MTNTTLSRIVVRAFIGPRPVYSRIILTIAVDIAAGSVLLDWRSGPVSVVIADLFSPFPGVV